MELVNFGKVALGMDYVLLELVDLEGQWVIQTLLPEHWLAGPVDLINFLALLTLVEVGEDVLVKIVCFWNLWASRTSWFASRFLFLWSSWTPASVA